MAKETIAQKKARLSKSPKYKTVISNLKEIREVEGLLNQKLNTLSKYIDEVNKEKRIWSKRKTALEVGDQVTMEVKDLDSGGDEGDLDEGAEENFDAFEGEEEAGEGEPDEVVNMEKEMKLLSNRIQRLKRNRNKTRK